MKNLILAIISTLTVSQLFAKGTIKPAAMFTDITSMKFDDNSDLNRYGFGEGYLQINSKEIIIILKQKPVVCPPGAFCAQQAPIQMEMRATFIKRTEGGCGVFTYTAESNNLKADGHDIKIEVKDFAGMTCEIVRLNPYPVEITVTDSAYDRLAGEVKTYVHNFNANGLKSLKSK